MRDRYYTLKKVVTLIYKMIGKSLFLFVFIIWQFSANGQNYSTFTDSRDGKEYKTVAINGRTWMAENLKFVGERESNCAGNCFMYGRTYSWEVAQSICPAGWSLPSESDWESLADGVGGMYAAKVELLPAGSSGFNALLINDYYSFGQYNQEMGALYWSSTETGEKTAYYFLIGSRRDRVGLVSYYKSQYIHVRCVK